jgi:hypothetical protein
MPRQIAGLIYRKIEAEVSPQADVPNLVPYYTEYDNGQVRAREGGSVMRPIQSFCN